ncbi:MAG TPA: hypothetical protein VGB32_00040, partial [Candidatus Bathyarchaeia archaeon]
YYFTPQEYPAIPGDLKEEVYAIYNKILSSCFRVKPRGAEAESPYDAPLATEDEGVSEPNPMERELRPVIQIIDEN